MISWHSELIEYINYLSSPKSYGCFALISLCILIFDSSFCRLSGFWSSRLLNTNLCSFYLLHLFIGYLRNWNLLNHLWHQHIQWVQFQKQDDHARFRNRNLCHFLFIISCLTCKLIFVAGRWGGNREGTENGKTSASRSLSSFWLYRCCLSGVYLIWTSWCLFFYRLMVFLFSSKLIAW